jgi:hypothetical protein
MFDETRNLTGATGTAMILFASALSMPAVGGLLSLPWTSTRGVERLDLEPRPPRWTRRR